MVKEKRFDEWNPWLIMKQNHLLVKFGVSFLVVGLVFRFLYTSDTTTTSPSSIAEVVPSLDDNSLNDAEEETRILHTGKCDLFTGDWIRDPLGPFYTNETCPIIESPQNCMKNGRPDSGYLYWRWKPRDCAVPRFNAKKFLKLMRNKSWAFIGDSISRNHVQSFLCILWKVEAAVEVYHDFEYKSRRWHFPSYNFTVSLIWSPLLLKADIHEDRNGVSASDIHLHLDKLDAKWADQYQSFDYVILSGGKWFLKNIIYFENGKVVGCHNCKGAVEYGFDSAYRKALKLVFDFVTNSDHNSLVLFRTASPDHFENGEWFSGGTCDRTAPFKEGRMKLKDIDAKMRLLEFEEFKKAQVTMTESKKRANLKIFDNTNLAALRPDGHPGLYREFHPQRRNVKVHDCLHWCLPGPIDSWNDLIMEMVLSS